VTDFAADTAIEATGEGRWRAVVPDHWFIVTGPNGGWIAAVLTRAMTAAAERPPRSLTTHFLEAPVAGPVEIETTIERVGGTSTSLSLRMTQDGRTVALALGVCALWRDGQPEWADLRAPEVPPPDEAFQIDPARTAVPAFMGNYDSRGVSGFPRQGEPAPAIGWIRTANPHPRDAVLLAALTDAWLPAAFVRLTEPTIVPTIELTIHWRADLTIRLSAGLLSGAHAWTLLVMKTGTGAGGVWEEDGELWSEDGVLLAQSRQLAIVRRPKS
jgi:acyl-CoA thioesterase